MVKFKKYLFSLVLVLPLFGCGGSTDNNEMSFDAKTLYTGERLDDYYYIKSLLESYGVTKKEIDVLCGLKPIKVSDNDYGFSFCGRDPSTQNYIIDYSRDVEYDDADNYMSSEIEIDLTNDSVKYINYIGFNDAILLEQVKHSHKSMWLLSLNDLVFDTNYDDKKHNITFNMNDSNGIPINDDYFKENILAYDVSTYSLQSFIGAYQSSVTIEFKLHSPLYEELFNSAPNHNVMNAMKIKYDGQSVNMFDIHLDEFSNLVRIVKEKTE